VQVRVGVLGPDSRYRSPETHLESAAKAENPCDHCLSHWLQVVDISNPQQPTLDATLFDYVDSQYTVALAGSYLLSTEADGGLAVYDVSKKGGLLPNYLEAPSSGATPGIPAFAQAANATNLYFAVANAVTGGGVLAYDTSTTPPTPVGNFSTGFSLCQALALSSNYLYVGAVDSLRV